MLERLAADDEYSTDLQIADLRINTVWEARSEDIPEPDFTNVHSHTFYELLISVSGVALTLFQGETIIIPAGSICLIPPDLYHSTRGISSGKSKRSLRFVYEKAECSDGGEPIYERFHTLLTGNSVPIVFAEPDAHEVYRMLTDCFHELSCGMPYAKTNTRLRLSMFFIQLLRQLSEQSYRADSALKSLEEDSRRKKIEVWLQENFRNDISEKDLAVYLNLSMRQTNRVLTQIYQCGFREIIINLRMHTAAELLAITDQSVEEIAYAVGYRSLSGFYSTFRQYWGVTAMQYRINSYKIHNNYDYKTPLDQI